jgi:hypothetical protein
LLGYLFFLLWQTYVYGSARFARTPCAGPPSRSACVWLPAVPGSLRVESALAIVAIVLTAMEMLLGIVAMANAGSAQTL